MSTQLNGLCGSATGSIFDRRILRRVALDEGPTGEGVTEIPQTIAAVVDVETTGLSLGSDSIIEFALRRIHFDGDGIVTNIEPAHVWREDPGCPIPAEVTRLTGLTDDHVKGQRIDEDEVLSLLGGSDLLIAHFAAFDKPFLAKRITPIADMVWGCSCVDIDWAHNGFEGRALGWLCAQAGWFFDGHRALADVDAAITLLRHPALNNRTILAELVENVRRPRLLVEAVGAEFEAKGILKTRGYRWNQVKRVWQREIFEDRCIAEETWLAQNIYSSGNRPKAMGPLISQIRHEDRFL
ncbi:MAG: 3'-5' exonuclease [Erythrobacter sp.]